MKKKIIQANNAGLIRLSAVEMATSGKHLLKEVAKQFNVHYTTITEWCEMYEAGGVERLNAPMKPRPKHHLNADELAAAIESSAEQYRIRLQRLLALANGQQLKLVASDGGVTPQSVMKDRRLWLDGKLPPTMNI